MNFKNKNILIVGLGKSGRSACALLSKLGANISLQDSKTAEELGVEGKPLLKGEGDREAVEGLYLGGLLPPHDARFDFVVLSPGVPPGLPWIQRLKENGAEIIGELELAYRIGKGRYIGITGTNGKTTTTTLVGEIFRRAGLKTVVEGNIGTPLCEAAEESTDETCHVVEVSSFQLETIKEFKPEISAILNITPDHLDRHGSLEGYEAAKARIFENQGAGDYLIINADDPGTAALRPPLQGEVAAARPLTEGLNGKPTAVCFSRKIALPLGAFVKEGRIVVRNEAGELADICGADEIKIPGAHNLENALAASAICYFAGIDAETIAAELREFPGVEHRIEPCGEIRGVRFFNDSKGTNPDAAIKAIEAMNCPTIIIAGGYDKGSGYDEFVKAFGDKVRHAVLLGATAEKIKETAENLGYGAVTIKKDMRGCVRAAFELAEPGYAVLLSPACASWDMYPNYEVRGRDFKEEVKRLADEAAKF